MTGIERHFDELTENGYMMFDEPKGELTKCKMTKEEFVEAYAQGKRVSLYRKKGKMETASTRVSIGYSWEKI